MKWSRGVWKSDEMLSHVYSKIILILNILLSSTLNIENHFMMHLDAGADPRKNLTGLLESEHQI